MAYWLMSSPMALIATSLSSAGAAKSGKPWARLTASCAMARRVISRMTDSVKEAALREISLIGLSWQCCGAGQGSDQPPDARGPSFCECRDDSRPDDDAVDVDRQLANVLGARDAEAHGDGNSSADRGSDASQERQGGGRHPLARAGDAVQRHDVQERGGGMDRL